RKRDGAGDPLYGAGAGPFLPAARRKSGIRRYEAQRGTARRDCFGWPASYTGERPRNRTWPCLPRLQEDPYRVLMSPGGNRAKQRKMICEKGVTPVNCPVCGKEMTSGFLNTYGMWN